MFVLRSVLYSWGLWTYFTGDSLFWVKVCRPWLFFDYLSFTDACVCYYSLLGLHCPRRAKCEWPHSGTPCHLQIIHVYGLSLSMRHNKATSRPDLSMWISRIRPPPEEHPLPDKEFWMSVIVAVENKLKCLSRTEPLPDWWCAGPSPPDLKDQTKPWRVPSKLFTISTELLREVLRVYQTWCSWDLLIFIYNRGP